MINSTFVNHQTIMDFNQVKLIVTDMDGTLLNSKGQVSSEFFELFEQLDQKNIAFVAASGRQWHSITHKLKSIKDRIIVIAENGGITMHGQEQWQVSPLDRQSINQIIPKLRKINQAYTVLCGQNAAYIETQDEAFIEMFQEYYSNHTIVPDLTQVNHDTFFKLAIYHFDDAEKHIYPEVESLKQFQIKVSGKHWVDISHLNTNKGNALAQVQRKLGLTKNETMVFGDYNNDLEMMGLAQYSFAMANAHPNIKSVANYSTTSNDELGVERVLKQVVGS